MSSQYQKALEAGYSAEEIQSYLSQKDPRYQKALEAGYSPEEISNFLNKSQQPKSPAEQRPKESIGSNIGRQIGRSSARISETALGAPRAFGEFLEGLVPEKALISGAEKVGLGKGAKGLLETTKKLAPYKLFPSSERVRDLNKFLFGKKVEPQTQSEAKADEFITDFTALTLPFPGSKFKVLKPGLLAIGGNIASGIVGQLGGTEKEQTYAKLGTFLTGSLINPKAAENLKTDLYSKARTARPADAKVSSKSLVRDIDNFEKQLTKGDPGATSKRKSLDLIKDIKSKVRNGEIEIEELEQFKRDINEARSGLYESFKSDKVGRKSAKRNLDMVSKFVDQTLNEYGKQNPEWEAFYRPANEVHGAIAQSKRLRNWIGRHIKTIGHPALLAELGLYHFLGLPTAITTGAAAAGGIAGAEIASRFARSPTLRKHYVNLINSGLKEDAVAVRENLKKLDEELEKEKS